MLVKISAKILVSKFWNISISGQSNIGIWPNIGKIFQKYRFQKYDISWSQLRISALVGAKNFSFF